MKGVSGTPFLKRPWKLVRRQILTKTDGRKGLKAEILWRVKPDSFMTKQAKLLMFLQFLRRQLNQTNSAGGHRSQFKGVGTINGQGDGNGYLYKFMIWAIDNHTDEFRIKIWWEEAR